jgi:hypothetical protein
VGSPRVFSLRVSIPTLFASSNQIIQAERSSHYHLVSAENDDVIKQSSGCNQVATSIAHHQFSACRSGGVHIRIYACSRPPGGQQHTLPLQSGVGPYRRYIARPRHDSGYGFSGPFTAPLSDASAGDLRWPQRPLCGGPKAHGAHVSSAERVMPWVGKEAESLEAESLEAGVGSPAQETV